MFKYIRNYLKKNKFFLIKQGYAHNFRTYNTSYLFDDEQPTKLFTFNDRKKVDYSDLHINSEKQIIADSNLNIVNGNNKNLSIIDIIFNDEIEVPKVLNSINYVLSKFNHDDAVYLPQILREYDDRLFPGDYVKIYTDEVITDNIDVSDNKETINAYDVYDKPKWEKGKWNLNYFRDVYHIKQENGDISDEKSLVYGKYFVVRFIFNNDTNHINRFKLDNVNVNFQLY